MKANQDEKNRQFVNKGQDTQRISGLAVNYETSISFKVGNLSNEMGNAKDCL